MMNSDEVRTIAVTFRRFLASEADPRWGQFDDLMSHLEYLSDSEVLVEAKIAIDKNIDRIYANLSEKDNKAEIVQTLDAVESILALHLMPRDLHPNNRYILEYYLTLIQMGKI